MNDKLKLVLLAATPFVIGNLFNIVAMAGIGFIYIVLSILFLAYWFWIGSVSYKLADSAVRSLLIGNSFGIACIIILLFSGIVFKRYIPGFVGFQIQMYFTPSVSAASNLLSVFINRITSDAIYGASFILMVIVYYSGYIFAKRR